MVAPFQLPVRNFTTDVGKRVFGETPKKGDWFISTKRTIYNSYSCSCGNPTKKSTKNQGRSCFCPCGVRTIYIININQHQILVFHQNHHQIRIPSHSFINLYLNTQPTPTQEPRLVKMLPLDASKTTSQSQPNK